MLVQGRDFKLYMYKNFGNNDMSTYIDLTSYIKKDGISSVSKTLDQMFKIDHSSLSIECKNIGGSLWSFIDSNLDTVNSLFPPWVYLSVDNKPYFLGLVNLESLTRDCKNESIKITAQDWSKQLANKFLDDPEVWSRTLSLTSTPTAGATLSAQSDSNCFISMAWNGGKYCEGPNYYQPTNTKNKIFFAPGTTIAVDNKVTVSSTWHNGTTLYSVASVKEIDMWIPYVFGWPWNKYDFRTASFKQLEVTLADGFEWPWTNVYDSNRNDATVNIQASDTTVVKTAFEEILQDYPINSGDKIHRVKIGANLGGSTVAMLNRLQVGDNIKIRLMDQSLQDNVIVAIDYFTKEYVLKSDLSGPVAKGAKVYLNEDDIKTLYHQNAKNLILKAIDDTANVDFTKFTKPTLSKYMFSSLGVPVVLGEPCVATNLDVNSTTLQSQFVAAKNIGQATTYPRFSLNTDDEWLFDYNSIASSEFGSTNITWSDQLLTAPAKVMPNAQATNFPTYTGRFDNRNYMDSWLVDFTTIGNISQTYIHGTTLYDYSCFRAWKLTSASASVTNVSYSTYTTSYSAYTSAGSCGPIFSAAIFKDIASSLGSGYSFITNDGYGTITVHNGTVNPSIFDAKYTAGHLKTTPYGTYIITKNGYGKIKYVAGVLSIDFCLIAKDNDVNTMTLFPNMFCHLNSTTNYIMAIFTTKNTEVIETEARLLELKAIPDPDPTVTILSDEKAFNFVSSMGRMEKDPYNNRILLIYDGRAYQISQRSSLVIERVKADGMNSLELIEYVCQILGAMAIPNPRGYLDIVSVNFKPTAIPIVVTLENKTQSRLHKYFFSVIRVNGYDDTVYADARGKEGTQSFEMSSHPLIFTTSQCAALADNLIQFYGEPRREESHQWRDNNYQTESSPFFEDLELFQVVKLNGSIQEWYITNLTLDLINKKASVKLLEAF